MSEGGSPSFEFLADHANPKTIRCEIELAIMPRIRPDFFP